MARRHQRPAIVMPFRGSRRPLWQFGINHDSPQADRLVAWWPFVPYQTNEGSLIEMVSGNNATLAVGGSGSAVGSTHPEYGHYVDTSGLGVGSNAYFTALDSLATRITGELTLSCWVNGASGQLNKGFVGKYQSTTSNRAYLMATENTAGSGKVYISYQSNGAAFNSAQTTVSVSSPMDNTWHFLIGTFLPSTRARIYIDGLLDKDNTTSIPSAIFASTCGIDLYRQNNDGTNQLKAAMFDVRIYAKYTDDAMAWNMWEPSTRWDLYWKPQRSFFFFGRTSGTTYSLSASLGVAGALASSPTNVVVTAEVLAAALSEAQAAVNNAVAGLSLSQSVLTSPGASNSSVSATALIAGSSLSPSTVVRSSITGQLSVTASASAAANLIASISIAAAVSAAEPVNATYPPILLSNTMSVAVGITEQLANAVALYETNAARASLADSMTNQVVAAEILSAFTGLSDTQVLGLATSIALATEEIMDALLAKISSDATAMGATAAETQGLVNQISEQIALELVSAFQALVVNGAPQVLEDLIVLVAERWSRADIIDEESHGTQRE